MLRRLAIVLLFMAAPGLADPMSAAFVDDRSSPERVVVSLYNAIGRHEYLRAWSYFRPDPGRSYEAFRNGYRNTADVEVRIGAVAFEGAAGSIHSMVPVALRATATNGTASVFTGCYRLTQVQPAVQEVPPFQPIVIEGGTLRPTSEPFETATGYCD